MADETQQRGPRGPGESLTASSPLPMERDPKEASPESPDTPPRGEIPEDADPALAINDGDLPPLSEGIKVFSPPPQSKSSFLRRPIERLPFDDDLVIRSVADAPPPRSGKGKPAFKEEDESREMKGCAAVAVVLLMTAVAVWFLKDLVDFSSPAPAKREEPPITRVEAMKQKSVVDYAVENQTVLGRKLTAPPPLPPAPAAPPPSAAATAGGMGIEEAAALSVEGMLEALAGRDVCYEGRRARQETSLYGLDGGFGISFGAPSAASGSGAPSAASGSPRLEFMPPTDRSASVLYYASFSDTPVKGFEGREARSIPDTPEAVSRLILSWVAEVANGPCAPE